MFEAFSFDILCRLGLFSPFLADFLGNRESQRPHFAFSEGSYGR